MKARIGAGAYSGAVHTAEATAANVPGVETAHKLIWEDDGWTGGDTRYAGLEKREEIKNDPHLSTVEYRINTRKGALRKRDEAIYKNPWEAGNRPQILARFKGPFPFGGGPVY